MKNNRFEKHRMIGEYLLTIKLDKRTETKFKKDSDYAAKHLEELDKKHNFKKYDHILLTDKEGYVIHAKHKLEYPESENEKHIISSRTLHITCDDETMNDFHNDMGYLEEYQEKHNFSLYWYVYFTNEKGLVFFVVSNYENGDIDYDGYYHLQIPYESYKHTIEESIKEILNEKVSMN